MYEADRIALIRSLDLLSLAGHPELDRIAELAAFAFRVKTVLISLVEEFDQHFLACVGTDLRGTRREISVCTHAIDQDDIYEVPDLAADPLFSANPLVTESPHMRFYAGAPLVLSSGYKVGTICLIDYAPRFLDETEREQLRSFAYLVVSQISLLRSMGRRDPVTGLANRQQLAWDLRQSQRTLPAPATGSSFLCIIDVLDVPSAHRLTQALGVAPVESIIRQLGYRLADALDDATQVYHVGVTRFAFVLTDVSRDAVEATLERLRGQLAEPVMSSGLTLEAGFHAGVAPFAVHDSADVLRKAVTAMHAALETGSAWCDYDADRDLRLQRHYRLATQVERALAAHEFALVYQPRQCLSSGGLRSAEALLRWRHPEYGNVAPDEFIPVIEGTTLMPLVTRWVLRQALGQMRAWEREGIVLDLSVNLSGADFRDGQLPRYIADLAREFDIAPSRLELEVTEGEWLLDKGSVAAQLGTLQAQGFAIAIDDFGAGYSNFSYLNELPATTIKVDRGLLVGIETSERRARLVRTLIKLSAELGYRTVAEGVETAGQLAMLREWQCDEAQGYHVSPPLAPDALAALVHRHAGRSPEPCEPAPPSSRPVADLGQAGSL
ncbi:GGDEF and EAL domain-containing protein [Luteimonas sp. FCS-9]|uniref:putative bifunctional diguanylate cyclase/phosphodiesterase n=1 Tax=Luteimonas sp. FCS-9 TaxID=1547516 RepID=UPI00069A6BB5|nr:GGDEF and EAL domain-containing protein [Luteimonas sp. FCS-9]